MAQPTATADQLRAQLTAALRDQRVVEVDRLLAGIEADLPAEMLAAAAELCMRSERWRRAADLWGRLTPHGPGFELRRRLAANLAALQSHRPDVYTQVLAGQTQPDRYRVIPGRGGQLTLAAVDGDGQTRCLSPDGDPTAAVQSTRERIARFLAAGQPIGLAGLGDGYLLLDLATRPPKLLLTQQHPVFLMEPDAALVFAALMIHDYSGPDGPIVQQRVHWLIGPDWADRFEALLRDDPYTLGPQGVVGLGPDAPAIQQQVQARTDRVADHAMRIRQRMHAHYAARTHERMLDAFIDAPSRQPRVLLMTSRFTTVLQYATRDVATAFEQLGWRTRTIIEPADHKQITTYAVAAALDAFQPDLLFKIDHLNYEYEGLFPPQLPTVCWIQDLLPNLTCDKAGRSIDQHEFALTFNGPMFIDRHGYRPDKVIDMPMMLARPTTLPATWPCDGDDLIYMSNVSKPGDRIVAALLAEVPATHRPLAEELCEALTAIYDRGESVPTHHDLDVLAQRLMICRGEATGGPNHAAMRHQIVQNLWTQLNIALYRQQALGWAVDAAERMGLRVGLYGHGWAEHPRFGRYARGFVEPGEPMAALIRRAKINLNLEPYPCFTHHRLLDGLMSGGFFLVREHPGNRLLPRLSDLLYEHFDDDVQTGAQALAQVPNVLREELTDILRDAASLSYDGSGDAVRQVRCWQRAGVLVRGEPAMARLEDISFTDAAGLRRLIERYIDDEPQRRRIMLGQRAIVEQRLTFPIGMRRLLVELRRRLEGMKKVLGDSGSGR
jgi:hypothetical protein